MFCRQCEQTAAGKGCSVKGVCGKDERTAKLQDLLIHAMKGIAVYGAKAARVRGHRQGDRHLPHGRAFSAVTNVNFDPGSLEKPDPQVRQNKILHQG